MPTTRRNFLRLSAAGLAAVAALPALRRRVGADPGPAARARRMLVINLYGGIRSSAGFFASPEVRYNPYGLIETATPFALGRLLDDTPPGDPPLPDADYMLGGGWGGAQVPRLREVADRFSVLGTWSMNRGDHARARVEEPSGDPSGAEPGLLTRVAAGLSQETGVADLEVPPFHLTAYARFGGGDGAMTRHVPVALASWESLPSAASADPYAELVTGSGWAADDAMRDRFDRRRIAARGGLGGQLAETLAAHRRGARTIGQRLAQLDFQIGDQELSADAALGTVDLGAGPVPLTNAMLYELFIRCLGPGGELNEYRDYAINAAVAVRMLQIGSPAVAIELGNFDFHSGERVYAPALYSFLGRLWATLSWLLARVPDPSGEGSLLDRTAVLTMSDFGRDQAGPTGWNGGEGSDHGGDYGSFYLAHAVMGAGIPGGRVLGGVRTDTYDARGEALQYSPQQLLATMLAAIGLDPFDDGYGLPLAGRVIEELWT